MSGAITKSLDTSQKLAVLSRDSQYDLACACATRDDEQRKRSHEDKWIYPVTFVDGRSTYLFKTLLSNECVNHCRYCPLRAKMDAPRCSLAVEELAKTFMDYYQARRVSGLFLSSGVMRNPDVTMERLNGAALILRKRQFKGYIHLKIIPGASEAAIRESLRLASAVSLNIEAPGEENFQLLSTTKNYQQDILRPIELISRLTAPGAPYARVKQTTQFVVGASRETDAQIIKYSWKLYKQLKLSRVYFSAYQRGAGESGLPGEQSSATNADLLSREHRLYQVDWLMRKYGFSSDEIPLDEKGNLSLEVDPKELWAQRHPEFFPVNINEDARERLLRVPGLGMMTVDRILDLRGAGGVVRSFDDLGKKTRVLKKTAAWVTF